LTSGSGRSLAEAWVMRLDAPRRVPLGETGTVRVTFSPAAVARATHSALEASTSNNIRVEARAEIPSAGASPSGLSSQVLDPSTKAQFEWRVRPQSEGTLEGRVWVYLRATSKDGGEAVERPLSVQPFTLQSVTFFGRVADQVLQMALIALGVGFLLILPHLVLVSRRTQMRANV
jgi:hypothetical protein